MGGCSSKDSTATNCPATNAGNMSKDKVTLFQKLGGHAAVKAAVDVFYEKVMADPDLKPFFNGVDMQQQRKKQAMFMTYVFGGPEQYKGKDMRTAHIKLIEEKGMNEGHFDKVANHLAQTLLQLGISKELTDEVIGVVATTKPIIFGYDQKSGCPATNAGGLSKEKKSLFDKLGGHAAVKAAVDVFYEKVMADPDLKPFFAGVDMQQQRKKQAMFMTYVFGGPESYKGKDMRTAHIKLIEEKGMNEGHFDKVANHLAQTLLQLGISKELTDEVIGVVATTKPIIFGYDQQGCPATSAGGLSQGKKTLFDKLGGHAAVKAAVDVFYDRIMADPQLKPFFAGIDMQQQRKKQAMFMTYVFGGPETYKGKDMRTAHIKLIEEKGMNESHFDMVANHLAQTLLSLGISKELTNEVIGVVATTKPLIFGK